MVAKRLVPGPDELRTLLDKGMTHQEVADSVGVTRAAISSAARRYGFERTWPRYSELIPWHVKTEHGTHYALRMLRVEARLRRGWPLATDDDQAADLGERLDSWKQKLRDEDLVVHYQDNTDEGFYYVPRRPGIDTDLIRVPDQQN